MLTGRKRKNKMGEGGRKEKGREGGTGEGRKKEAEGRKGVQRCSGPGNVTCV